MKTFIEHLSEAAFDSSRPDDNKGYTSGKYGQGQWKGSPPVFKVKVNCENYHESTLGTGSGVYTTLVSFPKTNIVSIRWVCQKCKDKNLTPFVHQMQIGNWLADSRVTINS